MYIIGITGASGSGKTTFSEILNDKLENSTIIHVDYNWVGAIFKQREKMIEIFGKEIFKTEIPTEQLIINGEYNTNLFADLNEPVFFSNLEKAKEAYTYIIPEATEKTIRDINKRSNYDYIIVDSLMLPILPEVLNKCDFKILMQASQEQRYKRLEQRNEMQCSQDLGPKRDTVCSFSDEYDARIINNGSSINKLTQEVLNIAEKIEESNMKKSDEKQESTDGMILGRFQPFTIGHMEYLKRALARIPEGKKMYIGIGRPFYEERACTIGDDHNKKKEANPYTFEDRRDMIISSVMLDPEIQQRISDIVIVPFPEQEDKLKKILDAFIPNRDVVQLMNMIPGDSWEAAKKKTLEDMGFKTRNIVDIKKPRITSATEVRKLIATSNADLSKKVPKGTLQVLEEINKNGGKRTQRIHSVEEFLDKIFITPMEIARQVLPRTPEQQVQVDEVGEMLSNLMREDKGKNK